MVHSFRCDGRMRHGPGSPRERHDDDGGPSSDTPRSSEFEGSGEAVREQSDNGRLVEAPHVRRRSPDRAEGGSLDGALAGGGDRRCLPPQIMDRLEFDLLFRWLVGVGIDDAVWDPTTFGKNPRPAAAGDVAHEVLAAVLAHPKVKRLLSTAHISMDGTMMEAWGVDEELPAEGRLGQAAGSQAQPRGRLPWPAPQQHTTHASTTDPDARLDRKGAGREAKLCLPGHALMGNRNGFVVDACLTRADRYAEHG